MDNVGWCGVWSEKRCSWGMVDGGKITGGSYLKLALFHVGGFVFEGTRSKSSHVNS